MNVVCVLFCIRSKIVTISASVRVWPIDPSISDRVAPIYWYNMYAIVHFVF